MNEETRVGYKTVSILLKVLEEYITGCIEGKTYNELKGLPYYIHLAEQYKEYLRN